MYINKKKNDDNLENAINNLSNNIKTIHEVLGDILLKIKIMEKEIYEIKKIINSK